MLVGLKQWQWFPLFLWPLHSKVGGDWRDHRLSGLQLEAMRWWLYSKPADVVMKRFPSAGEQQACTSDPGNCGAEHSGFLVTVEPAHPEQVSTSPIAVIWAALIPGPGSGVCVCGGGRRGSQGGGTESHFLPHKHTEVLNSTLGRGFYKETSTLGHSRSEGCETSPLMQGSEGNCLQFDSFPVWLGASHFTSPRLSFLSSKMARIDRNL